mgnify:CR=1 FL=1
MSQKLNELRDQRGKLVTEARAIIDKAEAEKRGLTAEEQGKCDELITKQEEIRGHIEREMKLVEAERSAAEETLRIKDDSKGKPADAVRALTGAASEEYRNAFYKMIASGQSGMNGLNADEMRALQSDISTSGGYLVAPMQMVEGLIKALDNQLFIRQFATKFSVPTAASFLFRGASRASVFFLRKKVRCGAPFAGTPARSPHPYTRPGTGQAVAKNRASYSLTQRTVYKYLCTERAYE